jgi:SAM-dependent methyltransferase
MRDPWGLNERLFAIWYPWVCEIAERAGQRELRAGLVGEARGRTLELGAGSGLNVPHYTAGVTELVVSEPSAHMHRHLRTLLADSPPPVGSWELTTASAVELPFDDRSFDTVVATYVHCTIPDPPAALREIARVLRPGGRYLFLEHIRAPDGSLLGHVQDLVELPHSYIAAGCHPNRRFEALLAASPLIVERAQHRRMPRAVPTVAPVVLGSARRV